MRGEARKGQLIVFVVCLLFVVWVRRESKKFDSLFFFPLNSLEMKFNSEEERIAYNKGIGDAIEIL